MTAPASFDVYQQIFALSWLSNNLKGSIGFRDDLEEKLYCILSESLTVHGAPKKFEPQTPSEVVLDAIGDWELVWGPSVLTPDKDTEGETENAMFVARCTNVQAADGSDKDLPSKDMYVVSIAATNPYSVPDWVLEDGAVNTVVKWSDFLTEPNYDGTKITQDENNKDAYISQGTAMGVTKLLGMTPPDWSGPNAGTSLVKFLSGLDQSNSMLVLCGHSLAGALSPALALYLKSIAPSPVGGFRDVCVYPTAGATPGNKNFADAYSAAYPPHALGQSDVVIEEGKEYRNVNARLWNHYDVVPHAWALLSHEDIDGNWSPMMESIPTLYGWGLPEDVVRAVAAATARATASGAVYYTLPGIRLSGKPPEDAPTDLAGYLSDLGTEHVEAYVRNSWASSDTVGLILPLPLPDSEPKKKP